MIKIRNKFTMNFQLYFLKMEVGFTVMENFLEDE
jgi:hypothetical protein